MSNLNKIIIGISGGIAAYKIPLLIRLFKKNNVQVKIVVTKSALKFVTPLTLETLSQNKIYVDIFDSPEEYNTAHISITDWADAMLVAPATANIIAKFATGIADDALSTTFMSFNKPIFIAPSMNTKMWDNEATQFNISLLKKRNINFIEPTIGNLACGYDGKGRMEEPEEILQTVFDYFKGNNVLKNKNVLITAGPTYEPIDPVRFIGNRSSGKMGYAIAEVFANKGANVNLISGPVSISTNNKNINVVKVNTADEMKKECLKAYKKSDITIMSAAVADYKPANPVSEKIKKTANSLNIKMKPNDDILAQLGKLKKKKQILIGFALETENEEKNAIKKLNSKNLDCIVLNSLKDKNSGFEFDTNKAMIISKNKKISLPLKQKKELAKDIYDFVINNLIKEK